MLRPNAIVSAPWALACWLGMGAGRRNDGHARILMLHGTPASCAGTLERMLRYVRRHFQVVPLAAIARDGARRDVRFRRQVALTFDDGLANNVEVAYPILQRLGLTATFFVCPGLVGSGRWLWNHEARERLRTLPFDALRELALQLGAPVGVEAIVAWMKRQRPAVRRDAEAIVREATPRFAPTRAQRRAFELAGWDALRRLDPSVVTVAAHTLTHPILPTLGRDEAEREIVGSRAELEARLQRPVRLFAYPNGEVDRLAYECVRRNFDAAVSVEEGLVEPGCDPWLLPRLPVPWNSLRLALVLHKARPRATGAPQPAMSG